MKTALKNLVTMGIILSILAGVLSVLPTSVFASETNDAVSESLTAKTITVDLNQDTDYSYSNMSYLSESVIKRRCFAIMALWTDFCSACF